MIPRVVLVTGPAGAGKSTISARLADTRPEPTVLLHHDLVRTFLRSGYVRPDKEWGPEAEQQWRIARDVCVAAVDTYVEAGWNIVIDAFAPGGWPAWTTPAGPVTATV